MYYFHHHQLTNESSGLQTGFIYKHLRMDVQQWRENSSHQHILHTDSWYVWINQCKYFIERWKLCEWLILLFLKLPFVSHHMPLLIDCYQLANTYSSEQQPLVAVITLTDDTKWWEFNCQTKNNNTGWLLASVAVSLEQAATKLQLFKVLLLPNCRSVFTLSCFSSQTLSPAVCLAQERYIEIWTQHSFYESCSVASWSQKTRAVDLAS